MRTRTRVLLVVLGLGLGVALFPAAAGAQETSGTHYATKFTEECAKKLAAGGSIDDCQKAPNPILPTTNELIWGTLSFAVLLVIMWKFALPPVRKMMADREEKIRGDLERGEQAKTEAEQVLEQYRAQLADARNEAARIVDEARQSAEDVRRDLIARAEADAAALRARAEEDVRLATDRAMSDLQARVGELSIQLAEKIVERNLDRATQQQLIDSFITQVGSN
jgi:F-type H+-transporting ATPase subunit b